MQIQVIRKPFYFTPDSSRVIARFLQVSDERSLILIKSVLALSEENVNSALSQLLRGYSRRHRNISRILENHFTRLAPILNKLDVSVDDLSSARKALMGSYFTMEYSIESAAFFNPSIVEDLDQSELQPDEKRVIFSFRATGEGHISSIVFRSAILDKNNDLVVEPVGKMLAEAEKIKRNIYEKKSFIKKLNEKHDKQDSVPLDFIFDNLGEYFTYGELMTALKDASKNSIITEDQMKKINHMLWLASSHYEVDFSIDSVISERVIFPVSATEQKGIEDARFVKFTDDSGEVTYYATYTAYDGVGILPKLMSTKDFYSFKMLPINGAIAKNKGMALFPRKIRGKYVMLCRIDGMNNYISYSENIHVWEEAKIIQQPKYTWELVQMGNAGSPIETEDGWLVITHGVGPMREYALGASLFDLENPEIELGRLSRPLMVPNETEREGYVPNVIYSCGSIVHNEELILPYAMSDHSSSYATINLKELLEALKNSGSNNIN